MSIPLGQKYKVVLLRNAARRGASAFLRQAHLIGLDMLLRKKHLIFYADATDVLAEKVPPAKGVIFTEMPSWNAFCEIVARQPVAVPATVELGSKEWFDRGWRLWIGEMDQRLACLGWLRNAEQSQDFFCQMKTSSELPWHVTTLPDFLGRNLHVLLWATLMRMRIESGVPCFYTNCRDYNIPSHHNIRKMGFRLIGYTIDSKITGRRTWHPLPLGR